MSDASSCSGTAFPLDREESGVVPTGKPYEWHLSDPESLEMVALPLEALAGRAFERQEAFRGVLERTAAFLVVTSRHNAYEGRDPLIVVDGIECGAVSSFLGVPLDVLARALLEMQRRGMVMPADDGALRITDLGAIDKLSEGAMRA